MPPEVLKFLHDIDQACRLVGQFTAGKTIDNFRSDPQLRSAVERQFITIGEALQQAIRLFARIVDYDCREPPNHQLSKCDRARLCVNFAGYRLGCDRKRFAGAVQNDRRIAEGRKLGGE
jgi:hypothetical protein